MQGEGFKVSLELKSADRKMLQKHAGQNSGNLGAGFSGRLPECRADMSSDTVDTLYDCGGVYACGSQMLIYIIAGDRRRQLHIEFLTSR